MSVLWQIQMFGDLQARGGEQTVITRFGTQKNALLLARLAFSPTAGQSREKLIDWLWADAPPAQGRNNLSVALLALRKIFEPHAAETFIVADRATIRLKAENLTTDAAAFLEAIETAPHAADEYERAALLEQAARIYRGDFLAQFYDDWALRKREKLKKTMSKTIAALRDLTARRGDFQLALRHARRAAELDAFDEAARAALMRLLAQTGEKNAALNEFRELEKLLQTELAVAPDAAIRRLAEQIKRDELPEAADSKSAAFSSLHFSQAIGKNAFGEAAAETGCFGREKEIVEICDAVRRHRLVTLGGAGGIGKTRLALEAARVLAPAFNGAVWFVPLADVREAASLAAAARDALDLGRDARLNPFEQISARIGAKPALLVLDNFEQIAEDGADFVLKLLAAAPGARCLITSRRLLRLAEEVEFAVAPLPVPPEADEKAAADLPVFPSVELFVHRARKARGDFQMTRRNQREIYEICRRLEGIPLALELAAARAASLTAGQILEKLSLRLDFFQNRRRDAARRQKTLRATLNYSFDLLTAKQKRFFAALAVFRGGWNARQAAAVGGEPNALDYLEDLRDNSLVTNHERDDEIYWQMLETVREYAAEKSSADEIAAYRTRHARVFLELAEAAEAEIWQAGQSLWLARLDAQHENLRAAMRFALDGGNADLSLRFAAALRRFWTIRGYLAEGREFAERALALDAAAANPFRAKTLVVAGTIARMQSDFAAARRHLSEALEFLRDAPAKFDRIKALGNLGIVYAYQGDSEQAERLFEESLRLARASGDRRLIAGAFVNFGFVAFNRQEYDRAENYNRQALELFRAAGDKAGEVLTLLNLAEISPLQNRHDAATRFLEASLRLNDELGDRWGAANSLYLLGESALARHRAEEAVRLFVESLETRRKIGDRRGAAAVLEALAYCAVAQKKTVHGLQILGAAQILREQIELPPTAKEKTRHAQTLVLAAETLAADEVQTALSAGRKINFPETLELARLIS